jgi:hypothetical protein
MPSGCENSGAPQRPAARPLTPAQRRVLSFCARNPVWHSLLELDRIRLLKTDDVLVVPSLIELGYLRHNMALRAVQITYTGQCVILAG